jgi:hypothetical protein
MANLRWDGNPTMVRAAEWPECHCRRPGLFPQRYLILPQARSFGNGGGKTAIACTQATARLESDSFSRSAFERPRGR